LCLKRVWEVFGSSERVWSGFKRVSKGFKMFWKDFRRVRGGGGVAGAGFQAPN
jgi:hypothetical protein